MPSLRPALLTACLLAALAQGCSQFERKPGDVSLASEQTPAKAVEPPSPRQVAELACKQETERKGIASVVGIFSRLRKGSAEEDYLACMKARGFEVKP